MVPESLPLICYLYGRLFFKKSCEENYYDARGVSETSVSTACANHVRFAAGSDGNSKHFYMLNPC